MNEKSEMVRIIVAFGDIEGFTAFCDAVTHDEIEYDPLMDKYDALIDEAEDSTGYEFDQTGDGFICTVNLAEGHNCETAMRLLRELWILLKKIQKLFEPRGALVPDGYRIVLASGYVKKKKNRRDKIVLRGKHINLAHKLLDLARGKGMVCHESFRSLLRDDQIKKNKIKFVEIAKNIFSVSIGKELK